MLKISKTIKYLIAFCVFILSTIIISIYFGAHRSHHATGSARKIKGNSTDICQPCSLKSKDLFTVQMTQTKLQPTTIKEVEIIDKPSESAPAKEITAELPAPKIQPQYFAEPEQASKVCQTNAGILPYVIERRWSDKDKKYSNLVYFLLRRDAKSPWSIPSGKDKNSNKELKQIAAEQIEIKTSGAINKNYILGKISDKTPQIDNYFVIKIQDLQNEKGEDIFGKENSTEKERNIFSRKLSRKVQRSEKCLDGKFGWFRRGTLKKLLVDAKKHGNAQFENHLIEVFNKPENIKKIDGIK